MEYPQSLPLAEIRELLGFIRNGTIKENLADVMHDVWVIQGYAQKMLVGDPVTEETTSTTDYLELLEKLSAQDTDATAQIAIDWRALLAWLLKLILDNL